MYRYIVQNGDTLLRVARKFQIEASALHAVNPQLRPSVHLPPGMMLTIPPASPQMYCIQPGDTPNELANRFEVPLNRLMSVNTHLDPQQLIPGQLLAIPYGSSARIVDACQEYGPRELQRDLEQLCKMYPGLLHVFEAGRSVMGKPIYAVRLGSGERKLHINASFHANEWITSLAAMTFLEDFARAASLKETIRGFEPQELLRRTQLIVVPMVNPDGVELAQEGVTPEHPFYREIVSWNRYSHRFFRWKANIRGVDLNDQFPAHWEEECSRRGTEGPGPRDYPGPAPLSEPEAAALAELTERERFDMVIALHTQGQEIYWNYRDFEPEDAAKLSEKLAIVSGYRSVKLSGSDAGYKDWFIQTYRKPGFTVECGIGVNPLPLAQFPDVYDEVAPLLLEAMRQV